MNERGAKFFRVFANMTTNLYIAVGKMTEIMDQTFSNLRL